MMCLPEENGHVNLKVYKDDGSTKIIYNFKINDLHMGIWKEVLDACPKRTRDGWNIIYTKMRQKLDDIHKTEQERELDLSRPLEEQDPIIKLNLLAKTKRKNADDLHDYFKSAKSLETRDKTLERASVHLGWQCEAERCRSPLKS
ncbi:hypothetical protein Tco_1115564 [Tanacetum coccineum]